jgi:excisionase family DNA binding protein
MDDTSIKTKRLSIGEASEYLGVSIDTLRRWEKKGRIEPLRSPGGHRYYTQTDLDNLFNKKYTRDEPTIRRKTNIPNVMPAPEEVKTYVSPYQQFAHDIPPPPPPAAQPQTIMQQKAQTIERPSVGTVPVPPSKIMQPTIEKPVEKKAIAEKQPLMPQIKPKTKLTDRQQDLLQGILKTKDKKKRSTGRIFKITVLLIIILAIVNLVIFYLWQTSPDIISPIP